eukprot:TRINITY_DN7656_c0_g1_i2.p1 TRINITY_DN7656_c0_g1~~TRINITY_DN7656_c0_g1_i2.p1  ORF type:complete len:503 (+),score=84.57 TRINITY_DN7656_c0_g1_i2:84-1592(+)
MSKNNNSGGYDDEIFVNEVQQLLRCPICYLAMRDAVQCPQQHAFCQSCIDRSMRYTSKCPVCKDTLSASQLQPARVIRSLVDSLPVHCPNHEFGCTEQVPLEHAMSHEENCKFKRMECPNEGCDVKLLAGALEGHRKECAYEKIQCAEPHCRAWICRHEYDEHSCFESLRQHYEEQINELRQEMHQREKKMREDFDRALRTLGAQLNTLSMGGGGAPSMPADAGIDMAHATASGILVENERIHLPVNGPKLLVSMPFSAGVCTWTFKMSGNSSFEFGVIAEQDKGNPETLHTRGTTGFYSSSTCGSRLPKALRVASGAVVEMQCHVESNQVLFFVNTRKQLELPLAPRNWVKGQGLRFAATLWNGTRMRRERSTLRPTHGPATPTPLLASDDMAALDMPTTANDLVEIGGDDPCSEGTHAMMRARCRICTSCLTCTGYGTNCCVSGAGGIPENGGSDCGCGPGFSGCARCGRCEACCTSGAPLHPVAFRKFLLHPLRNASEA